MVIFWFFHGLFFYFWFVNFFWLILYLLYIVSKEISIKFTLYILSLYHDWYMFILISDIYRIFLVFFFPYFYHLAFTIVSHAYSNRGTPKLYYDYWLTFHFIIYTIYSLETKKMDEKDYPITLQQSFFIVTLFLCWV